MATSQPHQQIVPLHHNQKPSTSPPVSISPQSHLDPGCYVKGSYLLTIEADVVVHPRCRLYTDDGKVTIKQGTILNERCILGIDKELNPGQGVHKPTRPTLEETSSLAGSSGTESSPKDKDIIVGSRAYLHSVVKIQPPCRIGDSTILEAGVSLLPGCNIGAHSKICAGVTLPSLTVVPAWTVVYGMNGQLRRKRHPDVVEDTRLDAMSRERQGVEALLKMSATKNLTTGSSRVKRESMIRTDSGKA